MKHKLLKLNAVLLLGVALAPLQGQTYLNMRPTSGTLNTHTLSAIRKLTFHTSGNMTVTNYSSATSNYALIDQRYMQFTDVGTGLDDKVVVESTLQLYPNPVEDVLNVQIYSRDGARPVSNDMRPASTVEIITIDGKLLYKAQLSGTSTHQINVSHYMQGIYLCRVNNGTSIETTKFFKK
jgi:hypothetical protein